MADDYVHGYDVREKERLRDQAAALAEMLHRDTRYSDGSLVLEAGCGVGVQTLELSRRSPGARFLSVDLNAESVQAAAAAVRRAGGQNVTFRQADLLSDSFPEAPFDHAFVCFVLEHLAEPSALVRRLMRLVRRGGTLTVIEGDHGSVIMQPPCTASLDAVRCLVELQASAGGDANIGRRLYPLLVSAGARDVRVSPRFVYADGGDPSLQRGFTLDTFTAMVDGVRPAALEGGMIGQVEWDRGIAGLRRCAEPDGVFCYTFFKAVARV